MSSASVGAAAAAAAAAAERMRQIEEEEMTGYSPKELAGDWEFKILRSYTGAFRSSAKLRAVLDEEARSGWVLVEKFDNHRIRLKRPAGTKVVEDDLVQPRDPYRTELGGVQGGIILAIVVSLAIILAGLCFLMLASG